MHIPLEAALVLRDELIGEEVISVLCSKVCSKVCSKGISYICIYHLKPRLSSGTSSSERKSMDVGMMMLAASGMQNQKMICGL
jgi:hypothetical protein